MQVCNPSLVVTSAAARDKPLSCVEKRIKEKYKNMRPGWFTCSVIFGKYRCNGTSTRTDDRSGRCRSIPEHSSRQRMSKCGPQGLTKKSHPQTHSLGSSRKIWSHGEPKKKFEIFLKNGFIQTIVARGLSRSLFAQSIDS